MVRRKDETDQHRLWQSGQRGPGGGCGQPDSAPVKRLVKEARERGMLIDASYGRSTRAVLIMDSDHVVLSALQPETVANRAAGQAEGKAVTEEEQ